MLISLSDKPFDGESSMLTAKPAWRYAFVGYIVVEVILIAAAFAWVALYSYGVHPGESASYYQAYAENASPIVALVAGIPVFFLTGRLFRRMIPDQAQATILTLVAISVIVTLVALIMMSERRVYQWALALMCWSAHLSAGWVGTNSNPRADSRP
jgi:cytochrome bd-type quinol oxidase subunit 2